MQMQSLLRAATILVSLGLIGACSSGPSTNSPSSASASKATSRSGTPSGNRPNDLRPVSDDGLAIPGHDGANSSIASSQLSNEQLRERAVAILLKRVHSNVPEERANAFEALVSSPGRLRLVAPDGLIDPNPGVRGVTALAISKAGLCNLKNDVRPLLNDPLPQTRAASILALWRCQERVDPSPLAQMLKSDQPEVRAQAAYVLGEMRESSARQMLADSARDLIKRAPPGAQRLLDLQIAEARIKLGDEQAITDVRSALFPARNDDLEAAALAAQIAGEVKDRWSVNALIYLSSVRDDEGRLMPPEVRLAAAGALAKMGYAQGPENARPFLTAPSPAHRALAAMVMGWSGDLQHLPNIAVLLDDSSPQVSIAAASAVLALSKDRSR